MPLYNWKLFANALRVAHSACCSLSAQIIDQYVSMTQFSPGCTLSWVTVWLNQTLGHLELGFHLLQVLLLLAQIRS